MGRNSDVPGPDGGTRHVLVVGGGISGLAAAESLVRGDARVRVTVIEATQRLGGIVGTERTDGFVMERGPDVVVAAKPATRALCERLGIGDRLQGTRTRGAYVYRAGSLRRLPAGLSGLMPTHLAPLATSGLLSPRGLLDVALEPWRAAPTTRSDDESLEEFVVRRMGREAYDRLVEPLLTGIYAGDGARLSLAATFPQLRALEREHGSLLRGLRARGATSPAVTSATGSAFFSMPTGLEELIEALERTLTATGRVTIRRGAPARALRAPGGPVGEPGIAAVRLAGGGELALDHLFSAQGATPNSALARGLGVALTDEGYVRVDTEAKTSVPGVYAAGDVTRLFAHQVLTAAHEGATAATALDRTAVENANGSTITARQWSIEAGSPAGA